MKMKQSMLLMLVLSLVAGAKAQTLESNEVAVVYYMPQTEIEVEIRYSRETLQRGPFSEFAEEFLGAENIIQADEERYQLDNALIHTYTYADHSRPIKVMPEKGLDMHLLTINRKGLLEGYNIPYEEIASPKSESHHARTEKAESEVKVLPLLEDQLKARTLREMAECAAKQIYRIRESRLYMLTGEVDKMPADGESMRLVLQELEKQETQLVALFVGSISRKSFTRTIRFLPTTEDKRVLLHFSQQEGVLPADSKQGTPVYLVMETQQPTMTNSQVVDKKAPRASQIYYNLPGWANVSVTFENNLLVQKKLAIPQLGVSVPLAHDLFEGGKTPVIHMDTRTGNIQSIGK